MNHGSSTYLLSSFLSIYCIYLWQNRGKSQLIHFKQNTWHCTKMTIIVEEVGLKIFPDGDNLLLIYILWERCLIIHYWFYWVKSKLYKANWESKSEISEIKHAYCHHCLKWCMEESTLPQHSNHLLKQTEIEYTFAEYMAKMWISKMLSELSALQEPVRLKPRLGQEIGS